MDTRVERVRNRRAIPGASRCRLLRGAYHDVLYEYAAARSPAGSRVSRGGGPAAALAASAPLSARRQSPRSVPFVAFFEYSPSPQTPNRLSLSARVEYKYTPATHRTQRPDASARGAGVCRSLRESAAQAAALRPVMLSTTPMTSNTTPRTPI